MKNLDKYKSLLGGELDGLLLTSRYSRHYAAEFDIAEGGLDTNVYRHTRQEGKADIIFYSDCEEK